jgi:methyl-accepting chemotaxis protein
MNKLELKSLRSRIVAGFLVVVVLLGGMTVFSLVQLRSASNRMDNLANQTFATFRLVTDVQHEADRTTEEAYIMLYAPAATKVVGLMDYLKEMPVLNADMRELGKRGLTGNARAAYNQIVSETSSLVTFANYQAHLSVPILDRDAPILPSVAAVGLTMNARTATGEKLKTILESQVSAAETNLRDEYSTSKLEVEVFLAVSVVIAVGFGLWVAQRIVKPIRRVAAVLERVAEGDLTSRVEDPGQDEVGQMAVSLNTTLGTIHDVVRQLDIDATSLSDYAQHASSQTANASAATEAMRSLGSVVDHEGVAKAIDASAALMAGIEETATKFSKMAEDLNAMISIFTIEPSDGEATEQPVA